MNRVNEDPIERKMREHARRQAEMEEEYYRQQQEALQQDRDTRRASRKVETYNS